MDIGSKLGIDTYAVCGAYGTKNKDNIKDTLLLALKNQIGIMDTSDSYDDAEELVGSIIGPYRNKIKLMTKFGANKKITSSNSVKEACERSLLRLNTDFIDYYQLHYDNTEISTEEVISGLDTLKQEGKILKYGFCHMNNERMLEYLNNSSASSLMFEYSSVSREMYKNISSVNKKYNKELIVYSITGRGILSGRYNGVTFDKGDIRHIDPLFSRCKREYALVLQNYLHRIGEDKGYNSVQMAIAWVLKHEDISYGLIGSSSQMHLEENLKAREVHLTDDEFKEMSQHIEELEEEYSHKEKEYVFRILHEEIHNKVVGLKNLILIFEYILNNQMANEKVIMPIFESIYLNKEATIKDLETARITLVELLEYPRSSS